MTALGIHNEISKDIQKDRQGKYKDKKTATLDKKQQQSIALSNDPSFQLIGEKEGNAGGKHRTLFPP